MSCALGAICVRALVRVSTKSLTRLARNAQSMRSCRSWLLPRNDCSPGCNYKAGRLRAHVWPPSLLPQIVRKFRQQRGKKKGPKPLHNPLPREVFLHPIVPVDATVFPHDDRSPFHTRKRQNTTYNNTDKTPVDFPVKRSQPFTLTAKTVNL